MDEMVPQRVLVAGMPKSGTYLVATILRTLGLEHRGHLTNQGLDRPDELTGVLLDTPTALQALRPNQFITSHVPASSDFRAHIRCNGIRVIAVTRDPRDAVASYHDFVMTDPRYLESGPGARILHEFLQGCADPVSWMIESVFPPGYLAAFADWQWAEEALWFRFEDLLDCWANYGRIARWVGVACPSSFEIPKDSETYRPGPKVKRHAHVLEERHLARMAEPGYCAAALKLGYRMDQ